MESFLAKRNFTKKTGGCSTYLCPCSWLLVVESGDLSQAEKEMIVVKAEQNKSMTTIFTQNDNF